MKIRIDVKDPNGIDLSIRQALTDSLVGVRGTDMKAASDAHSEEITKAVCKWVDCQEYLSIEIDTETDIATVIPQ